VAPILDRVALGGVSLALLSWNCRCIFFFGQRFFSRVEISLTLVKLLLLLGLPIRSEPLLNAAFNLRVLLRFALLFLTRDNPDEQEHQGKTLFHRKLDLYVGLLFND
jgi:hypothetical protein